MIKWNNNGTWIGEQVLRQLGKCSHECVWVVCSRIYFNWRLTTLQYCGGFSHTVTWISLGCICVPILNPPPSSLPIPSLWVVTVHRLWVPCFMHQTWDWWSISHMVMYIFQCYSLKSSHSCLLPQSPKVCSLYLCLFFCFIYRVVITVVQSPVVSDSLEPHGLQHVRPLCPSPSPKVCPSSCPLHRWCYPDISSYQQRCHIHLWFQTPQVWISGPCPSKHLPHKEFKNIIVLHRWEGSGIYPDADCYVCLQ